MCNHAQCGRSKPYFFFWHQLSNSWRSVAGRRNLHQLGPMIRHLNFFSTWQLYALWSRPSLDNPHFDMLPLVLTCSYIYQKLIRIPALGWFGLRQTWRRFWQPFCPRFYMACTVVYHTLCPHQNVFKIVCLGNTQIIKWDAPKMFGFNPS